MYKAILSIILFFATSSIVCGQQPQVYQRPNIPFGDVGWKRQGQFSNNGHFQNRVGYMPVIMWFPQGMQLNVSPVMVSPNRRYVTIGINMGISHITEVHTFTYRR